MYKKGKVIKFYEGNYDTKKIKNRYQADIPNKYLEKIENGITSEDLGKFPEFIPVFKYRTQITIHGKFNELEKTRIDGYKFLFQNKNQSIGVKWGAIDEIKRKYIWRVLRLTDDWYYKRSSTERVFRKTVQLTEENFKKEIKVAKKFMKNVDKDSFLGTVQIYMASVYSVKYLVTDLRINMIFENDIFKLLNSMGYSRDWFEKELKVRKLEDEKKSKTENKQRKKDIKKERKCIKKNQWKVDWLQDNFKFKDTLTNEEGVYAVPKYNKNKNDIVFKVIRLFKESARQRYFRMQSTFVDFETLKGMKSAESISFGYGTYVNKIGVKNVYKIL